MSEVTRILERIERGETQAAERLLPLVYDELRRMAAQMMAQEKPGQTLQPTALVHEAYLRLVRGQQSQTFGSDDGGPGPRDDAMAGTADGPGPTAATRAREPFWQGRRHFFAAAAQAMRRILVENARRKRRLKHGGDRQRIDLDDAELAGDVLSDDVLALDEALARLTAEDPIKTRLVELRFFAGMNVEEAAAALGIAPITAKRYWRYARAWLRRELSR